MRLWIDTDVGSDVDDALTLAYALRHPEIELVGVSTVFGDVALRTRIAEALLDLEGRQDVPVLTGLGVPLTAGRKGRMFGHEGQGLLEHAKPQMRAAPDRFPEQTIGALAEAMERARPEALLSIGPMTNLGALPRAGLRLPALTVMGGKLTDAVIPGALPQIPEWNWWCDPEAVASVLEQALMVPPRVVPIEVTMATHLAESDWQQLADAGPLGSGLQRLCVAWLRLLREEFKAPQPEVRLHDPMAAMTLIDASVCRFAAARIRVDRAGLTHHESSGTEIQAANAVDAARLRQGLMDAWLNQERA